MPKKPHNHDSDLWSPSSGEYIYDNMGYPAYSEWVNRKNAANLERIQADDRLRRQLVEKADEDMIRIEREAAESMARLNNLIAERKLNDSKKKLVWVTLNWDEKLVTPTGTVPIVQSILENSNITKAACFWEWRDPEAATGLHCHLVLVGNTRRITEFLKRRNGKTLKATPKRPYTKLCKGFDNLKLCPLRWYSDKINYCLGKTNNEEKNAKKSLYDSLRKKFDLPNIFK